MTVLDQIMNVGLAVSWEPARENYWDFIAIVQGGPPRTGPLAGLDVDAFIKMEQPRSERRLDGKPLYQRAGRARMTLIGPSQRMVDICPDWSSGAWFPSVLAAGQAFSDLMFGRPDCYELMAMPNYYETSGMVGSKQFPITDLAEMLAIACPVISGWDPEWDMW